MPSRSLPALAPRTWRNTNVLRSQVERSCSPRSRGPPVFPVELTCAQLILHCGESETATSAGITPNSNTVTPMPLLQLFRRASSRLPFRPYDKTAPIVFMHIPKTSGTSFINGLRAAILPVRPVSGYGTVLFGHFSKFDTISANIQRDIYLDDSDLPDGDFVSGHFALSTLRKRYGTTNFLTILREPTSRILSHWLYWRSFSNEELRFWGLYAEYLKQARHSLAHFLSCKDIASQTDNVSVRMLLYPHRLISPADFINPCDDDDIIKDAISNLNYLSFIDIIENPMMSTNIQTWLQRSVEYPALNETGSIPAALRRTLYTELTPEVFDLIESRGRLDLKLWSLVARQRITDRTVDATRHRTILHNVARYATLMHSS